MSVRTRKIALGPLEISIMHYLWKQGPAEVKTVHHDLGRKGGQSRNTFQSAMDRLFKKGLLSRHKVSHAFLYEASVSQSQMVTRVMDDVLRSLSESSRDDYLLAFLDHATETDGAALDTLERLIREKRQEQDAARRGDDDG
jgi:predicted transcriptional regulator